jgi:hypothetical protein
MITWIAPPAESRSGLAVYSMTLLPFLEGKDTVRWLPPGGAVPSDGGRRVYNLGNHPDNAPAMQAAWDSPDTVILHDVNLHHAALAASDPGRYFECGDLPLELRAAGAWSEPLAVHAPALAGLLNRQRLVFVHSRYALEVLRMRGVRVPVEVLPMGVAVPVVRSDKDPVSIGLFGHMGSNRELAGVLEAFRRLRGARPALALKLIGQRVPDGVDREPGIVVKRGLSDGDFFKELSGVAVALNLRYPVMGETSLTTLQAMALGTVCLVYELGAYAELPDNAVLKVGPGAPWDPPLEALLDDAPRRKEMEKAAVEHVRAEHAPARWAERFWEGLCGSRN